MRTPHRRAIRCRRRERLLAALAMHAFYAPEREMIMLIFDSLDDGWPSLHHARRRVSCRAPHSRPARHDYAFADDDFRRTNAQHR